MNNQLTAKERAAVDTLFESIFRAIIRGTDLIIPPKKLTRELKRAIRHAISDGGLAKCVVDGRHVYRIHPSAIRFWSMLVAAAASGAAGVCDDDGRYDLAPRTRRMICNLLDECEAVA